METTNESGPKDLGLGAKANEKIHIWVKTFVKCKITFC